MVLKCYHYLHPMVKFEIGCVNQTIDVNSDLDIFEQTPSTSEPIIQLVKKEMLISKCY
jgi:hypothetical protein